jgi:YesN/AraC family two-component response regulator
MAIAKILFVDDEANVRMTLPKILEMHGFEVDVAATCSEGLKAIQSNRYDVLLSDLNIGEPGDGFTLVSAMRRVQPHAATLIITGYPAFESALQAIRAQVDDYVVKPALIPELIETLKRSVKEPRKPATTRARRISAILQENLPKLLETWLKMVKKSPKLSTHKLSDKEWIDHLAKILPALFAQLDDYPEELREATLKNARKHGQTRARQRFQVPEIQIEGRLLRQAIYHLLQTHLLSVDISYWITDMMNLNDALDSVLVESVQAFLLHELQSAVSASKQG